MNARNIGGSVLPSSDAEILQPVRTYFGMLQVRVIADEDTHGLFFVKGDVLLARHANGYSCHKLATLIRDGGKAADQADHIESRGGVITDAGRALISKTEQPMTATPEPTKTTVHLTKAQLKALLLHIPKVDARQYLPGLHVYLDLAGVCVAEATDGHRLLRLVLPEPRGPVFDVIIPRALVVEASTNTDAFFEVEGDGIALSGSGATRESLAKHGTFPACDRVLPLREGTEVFEDSTGCFDLRYHTDARKAIDILEGRKESTLPPVPFVSWTANIQRKLEIALKPGLGMSPDHVRTDDEVAKIRAYEALNTAGMYFGKGYSLAVMPLRS